MKRMLVTVLLLVSIAMAGFSGAQQEGQDKTTVELWYLWGGAEGERVEAMIREFNTSQNLYEVRGLSVPDIQKIKVAIAAGEGPDIADDFSDNIASYADTGILESLDRYISNTGYNTSDFIPAAIETCKYDGKLHSLPISINLFMLFSNRGLLSEAGIANPPRTDKELLETAIKTTRVESDGSIRVMGFPDFPTVYYLQPMSIAFGGEFSAADGSLTPDNSGTTRALDLIVEYRKRFGVDNVTSFNSAAAYLTEADPFVASRQVLRIDGPWFGKIAREDLGKSDLDYDVSPLPFPAGKPELSGSNLVRSSVFYIPSNAKNKEGAWAFMSWLHEEKQMSKLSAQMGWVPARISSLGNPAFGDAYDFEAFAGMARSKNLKTFPSFPGQAEYAKILSDAAESAMLLESSTQEALETAAQLAAKLE